MRLSAQPFRRGAAARLDRRECFAAAQSMSLHCVCLCARAAAAGRSGRFSVVKSAVHNKEKVSYAVKVVDNKSLSDDENLEALETEVRAPPPERLSA